MSTHFDSATASRTYSKDYVRSLYFSRGEGQLPIYVSPARFDNPEAARQFLRERGCRRDGPAVAVFARECWVIGWIAENDKPVRL